VRPRIDRTKRCTSPANIPLTTTTVMQMFHWVCMHWLVRTWKCSHSETGRFHCWQCVTLADGIVFCMSTVVERMFIALHVMSFCIHGSRIVRYISNHCNCRCPTINPSCVSGLCYANTPECGSCEVLNCNGTPSCGCCDSKYHLAYCVTAIQVSEHELLQQNERW
jgi:hypothetical protein